MLTRESDYNDEAKPSAKVTTDYAIGMFDVSGLDTISLVPMKYTWLKKINPSYLENSTDADAVAKARRFIELYKRIASRSAMNESKIDLTKKWYFGNNLSRNLRVTKPAWNKPFFLTTSYEYAEDYADYGVYEIELSNEARLDILDFRN